MGFINQLVSGGHHIVQDSDSMNVYGSAKYRRFPATSIPPMCSNIANMARKSLVTK